MTEQILPARLQRAIDAPRQEVVVLRSTMREAREALDDDRRALHPDFDAVVEAKPASGQLRFANGSRIRYIGGDRSRLEHSVRGLSADHVDGGGLLDDRTLFFLTEGRRLGVTRDFNSDGSIHDH